MSIPNKSGERAGDPRRDGDPAALIAAELRCPARIKKLPALAACQVRAADTKPRGIARLRHRIAKTLYFGLHQRLRLPATGTMEIAGRDGQAISIEIDATNTAFIDLASRQLGPGYAPTLTALLDWLAPQAGTVYDIGANWGYFSALVATHPAFDGTVFAFEITPDTRFGLERMIRNAGLDRWVKVQGFGLSSAARQVELAVHKHSILNHIAPSGHRGRTVKADVRRIDDLELPPPDVVKIDVEDHESEVIEGARRMFAASRPVVIFENRLRNGEAILAPIDGLVELGYRLYVPSLRHRGPEIGAGETPRRVEISLWPMKPEDRPKLAAELDIVAVHPGGPIPVIDQSGNSGKT